MVNWLRHWSTNSTGQGIGRSVPSSWSRGVKNTLSIPVAFPSRSRDLPSRFTDIVNGLEALGNTYKESKKVMKILRSLSSKWHTKVTTIQEAKDLTKLPLENLIGSLMTYEINLPKKQQEGENKKKKSIAFKAITKEEEEVE
ncbi:hypothetical protein CK203_057733 [Vitis vinifera]|uniref:UBN2 domain-containing protein n=1 Tax=Vitis vinifera TaxID=29760 RepID=A0A438GME2_VITVI|nr:hypothetical protein CK203_057733 [Vitis vinifera]